MAARLHYTVLDWFSLLTAVLAPVPTLLRAFRNWRSRELGVGDRRPEPNILALVGNMSSLFFACTERLLETLGLNAWGGAIQLLALAVFLKLRADGELAEVLLISGVFSAIYFATLVTVGLSHLQLTVYQTLCTMAGMLAAAAPLLNFYFLHEHKSVDLLPPFWLLGLYTMHGAVWCYRGLKLGDWCMLAQNATVTLCSVTQLLLLRRYQRIKDCEDLRVWLLSGLTVPVPQEIPPLEEIPPALPQVPQPVVRRSPRIAAAQAAANQ